MKEYCKGRDGIPSDALEMIICICDRNLITVNTRSKRHDYKLLWIILIKKGKKKRKRKSNNKKIKEKKTLMISL